MRYRYNIYFKDKSKTNAAAVEAPLLKAEVAD